MSQVNLEQLIKKAMAENQSFRHCQVTKPGQIATVSIGGKTVKAICPTVVTGNAVAIKLASPYNGIEWVVVGSNTSGQISSQTLDDRKSSSQTKTEPVDRFDPDGFILYGKWSDEPVVNPPINNSESSWTLSPPHNVIGEANKQRQYFVEYPHAGGEYATKEDAENDKKKDERSLDGLPGLDPIPLDYAMYFIGSAESLVSTPYDDYESVSGPNISKALLRRNPTFRFGLMEYTLGGGVPVSQSFLTPWERGGSTVGTIAAWGKVSGDWRAITDRYQNLPKRGSLTYNANFSLNPDAYLEFQNGAIIAINVGAGDFAPDFGMIYGAVSQTLPSSQAIFFIQNADTEFYATDAATGARLNFPDGTRIIGSISSVGLNREEPTTLSIDSQTATRYWDINNFEETSGYFQNVSESGWGGGLFLLVGLPPGQSPTGIVNQIKSHWQMAGDVIQIFPPGGLNNGDGGGGGGEEPPPVEPEIEKVFLDYQGYVEHLYVRDFSGQKEIQLPISFRAFSVNQPEDYEFVITNADSEDEAISKYRMTNFEELVFFGTTYANPEYQLSKKILSLEPYVFMRLGIGTPLYEDFVYDKRPAISHSMSPHKETRETYLAAMDEDKQYLYVYVLYGLSIDITTIQWQKEDIEYYLAEIPNDPTVAEREAVAAVMDERRSERLVETCNNPGCLGYNHLRCFKIKKTSFTVESDVTYDYPTLPPESMKGQSGYILDAFSKYTMGSEVAACGDAVGTDARFIHKRVNSSAFSPVHHQVPLGESIYHRATLPGVEFENDVIIGKIYGCSRQSVTDFYDNGAFQKQCLLYYGFPALQKYVRDDLPTTYGALGVQPSTRGVVPSHELWKQTFSWDNHCKPRRLWSDIEKSWYSLTLEPKELSYLIDAKDRFAEGYFHQIIYGNKQIFTLAETITARRFALYFQLINTSSYVNTISPYSFRDILHTNSENLGAVWEISMTDITQGLDYGSGTDGLTLERGQHFSPDGILWDWYFDSQLTEQESQDLLNWQNTIFDVSVNEILLKFAPVFQAKDVNEPINFNPVSANDYLTVLPFFCSHNTPRNILITISNNDTEWTENTVYFKLKSNFANNLYLQSTLTSNDDIFSKIPGTLHSNSLILSHTAVYRETFLDKNSNLFLNTSNEFRIPLTKNQKKDDTIVSAKSFVLAKGLGIPYLGSEGSVYLEGEYEFSPTPVPKPSTYLLNTKDVLLKQVLGSGNAIPPLWAGRLWHFMPINKG